jgi:uncharacterized protein (DUF2141 family)
MKTALLFLLVVITVIKNSNASDDDTLVCKITNIKAATGYMQVAAYNKDSDFLKGPAFKKWRFCLDSTHVDNGVLFTTFLLPNGEYGLAFHHDKNRNLKMDKNFIGVPTEPFTFSRPFNILRGPPKYKDVVYVFKKPLDTLGVRMQNNHGLLPE